MVKVQVKKLTPTAVLPTLGSEKAAAYDLYSDADLIIIEPGACEKVPTGLAITPPEGYFGAIFARSGLATKRGLRPANCVGVCDEDYTGEYIIAVYNDGFAPQEIRRGDRIAQLIFLPYVHVDFEEVENLNTTDRGSGGFGSTGMK